MEDTPPTQSLQLRPPGNGVEWNRYYELRWRLLRAPWRQPRGSEKDDRELDGLHVALWTETGIPVAAGRVNVNTASQAQIRYMAVDPAWSRRGLGRRILQELESRAWKLGATTVVLNARAEVQRFYERSGYRVTGAAGLLFGSIPHVRMEKQL